MNKKLIALACMSVFAIAACKPPGSGEPASAPDDDATAATAADDATAPAVDAAPADIAPATDAIAEVDRAEAPAGLDVKAFAGTFVGDDIELDITADGHYTMSGAAVGGDDGDGEPASLDGTWTVEEDGKRIRLDPNEKGEDDSLYAVNSNDELQALDDEGNPPENDCCVLTRSQ